MVLNPDDLLIFKTREEEKELETSKKQKKQQTQEPAPVEAQRPQQKAREQKQKPQKQKERVQQNEESYYIAPQSAVEPTSPDFATVAMEVSGEDGTRGEQKQRRRKMDSREIASHMNCELHPWRKAYAICNYCKRAFCYEDIIESGGKYYCFDDIERVPEAVRRAQLVKYNNLGYVAALLYVAAFAVFIYYSFQSIDSLLLTAAKVGPVFFLSDLTSNLLIFIGEMVFAFGALISGFFIFISADGSFRISALSSILGVALFSYEYVLLGRTYLAIIPAILFLAFLALSFSRVAYETITEEGFIETGPTTGMARSSF